MNHVLNNFEKSKIREFEIQNRRTRSNRMKKNKLIFKILKARIFAKKSH